MSYLLDDQKVPRSKTADSVAGKGWVAIHAFMTQIPRNIEGLREYHALLASERKGANRSFVVHRLYRAFTALRMEIEEQSLYAE